MTTHSRALRLEILASYDSGETAESLRDRYGVSIGSIRNWRRLRDETGDVGPRPHGGGPARSLDESALQTLLTLRVAHPEDTLEGLVRRLAHAGILTTVPTVGRYLKEAGFVRHGVKSSAKAALSSRPQGDRRYRRSAPPPDLAHRRAYPSDVTDAEWALLEPLIPQAKTGGRKEERPKREIVNAIFYVLRSGCQWRMLPHDFPPWETVYDYFHRWRDGGVWETVNQALREKVRQRAGWEKTPSAVIIDSQSVKTTEKGGHVDMTGQSA